MFIRTEILLQTNSFQMKGRSCETGSYKWLNMDMYIHIWHFFLFVLNGRTKSLLVLLRHGKRKTNKPRGL
jgi:hypothetical protein